nr:peptide toxin 6 precursor [Macrothele gigas]
MIEENLFGKELSFVPEENRNSRHKRCMGYDIECNERLHCCADLECVKTSGRWWYKKTYCRRKSG